MPQNLDSSDDEPLTSLVKTSAVTPRPRGRPKGSKNNPKPLEPKQPKKRGRPPKDKGPQVANTTPKRGPGRPKKDKSGQPPTTVEKRGPGRPRKNPDAPKTAEKTPKRGRGRPRKDAQAKSPSTIPSEYENEEVEMVMEQARTRGRRGGDGGREDAAEGSRRPGAGGRGLKRKASDIGAGPASPGRSPLALQRASHGGAMVDYMGSDVIRGNMIPMDAVVKVFCTHTEPNYSLPWQRKRQMASTSSGFIIPGRRVLTNAHSVEHHTLVKLKKLGSDKKYVAKVLTIGVECDLALLTVEDDEFFSGVTPVHFGQLPALQDDVTVVGYPVGGATISVTQGVVSRIEVTSYSHGSSELLGMQIDAAINSGNSGGPAFNPANGQCVGVAFQSLKHEDAENIGYVIPPPVIIHFLTDYERNSKYTGFPTLGFEVQKLENPDVRKFLHMGSMQNGVRVRRIEPLSAAAKVLKVDDILLSFDGIEIANDGTVEFRNDQRMCFHYLVSDKFTGESARIKFLRDGKVHEIQLPLKGVPRLVPVHIEGVPPTYLIVGGLVFTTICIPYLKSEYGKDYDYDAPVKLLDRWMHGQVQQEGQNVVVLGHVLAADINVGYEDIVNTVVKGFNNKPVNDLKQLAKMVESCSEQYLRFELEHDLLVVLQTKKAHAATKDILRTHCIPSAKSADLTK